MFKVFAQPLKIIILCFLNSGGQNLVTLLSSDSSRVSTQFTDRKRDVIGIRRSLGRSQHIKWVLRVDNIVTNGNSRIWGGK